MLTENYHDAQVIVTGKSERLIREYLEMLEARGIKAIGCELTALRAALLYETSANEVLLISDSANKKDLWDIVRLNVLTRHAKLAEVPLVETSKD